MEPANEYRQPFYTFLKAIIAFFATGISILFSSDHGYSDERVLSEGSDLFGEQNFRTGRLDAVSDPDGWYEKDL